MMMVGTALGSSGRVGAPGITHTGHNVQLFRMGLGILTLSLNPAEHFTYCTVEALTSLTKTHGTYSWGGCRASVSWALACMSCVPRSPVAHSMMLSADTSGAYTCRHCGVGG